MTDTEQTLTLECCCEEKRQIHIHTEIDSGAGTHLVSRLVECPFCDRYCKLEIEASAVPIDHITRSGDQQPANAPDGTRNDIQGLRRALRDRVFPTELAEGPESE
uniref:Uncharacterized protein n=1 Tax=Candidatus Kentrum sp. FW TaxID=2126338 RepID=A0A450TUT1_9GAMM|nr:MAG: hypothetical protein BECKFW1821C_GA0114237_103714 [Candidatus Kentron sp. FW]